MLNVNVYHPTPVISGPIALINPHSTPKKKKKKTKKQLTKKKKPKNSQRCRYTRLQPKLLPTSRANF